MMEFKGTKGEWIIDKSGLEYCDYAIIDNRGFSVIAHIPNTGDQSSNAKLISAAPELLEALIEISKGNGAYDTDKLKHASNCIDNMKEIALEAIEKALK